MTDITVYDAIPESVAAPTPAAAMIAVPAIKVRLFISVLTFIHTEPGSIPSAGPCFALCFCRHLMCVIRLV